MTTTDDDDDLSFSNKCYFYVASTVMDDIWAMVIVWKVREKIIRTLRCCVVYNSSAQWYAHTYEQFLQVTVGLNLHLIFVICIFS